MAFIWAMLFGGIICAIAQACSELKLPFPVTAVLMVALGGILTPLGVMDQMLSLGAGGPSVTAMGCGNGAYAGGAALSAGNMLPVILVAALNIILVLMGALCGGALAKKLPDIQESK